MTARVSVTARRRFRYAAATLMLLVALACGAGGISLRGADASQIEGGMASGTDVRITSAGLVIVSILMLASSVSVFLDARRFLPLAVLGSGLFLVGGFVGNYLLFGSIRPLHTGTNTVVVVVILLLLWKGWSTVVDEV